MKLFPIIHQFEVALREQGISITSVSLPREDFAKLVSLCEAMVSPDLVGDWPDVFVIVGGVKFVQTEPRYCEGLACLNEPEDGSRWCFAHRNGG